VIFLQDKHNINVVSQNIKLCYYFVSDSINTTYLPSQRNLPAQIEQVHDKCLSACEDEFNVVLVTNSNFVHDLLLQKYN
jgi:hypothetical protein